MPSELFLKMFERELAPRLFRDDFFARRFPELIDTFSAPERFSFLGRTTFACPIDSDKWEPKCATELSWTSSVHPQFEEAAELARIQRRYDVGLAGLRYTIPRLKNKPEFRAAIGELKKQGWKDWHLLSAMLSAAANYRVRQRYGETLPTGKYKTAIREEMFSPETENHSPLPIEVFNAENLEMNLLIVSLSSLAGLGLEPRQRFPVTSGLFKYLRHRWLYFDLDVPHPDVFDEGVDAG
jgi:hypothetical protein